jgi:hypothetical protein
VFITGGNGDPHKYGRTYLSKVSNSSATACQAAGFDTHSDGDGVTFTGCSIDNPTLGPSGGKHGIQLRGINNKGIGCTCYGGTGFRFYSDFPAEGSCDNNAFIGCSYYFSEGDTDDNRAVIAVGSSSYPLNKCFVDSLSVYGANVDGPVVESFDARITIGDMSTQTDLVAGGRLIEVNDGGIVHVKNLFADITESGASINLTRIASSTGEIIVSDLELLVDTATLNSFCDLNSTDGTFILKKCNTDERPSVSAGYVNAGGSAVIWVDYVQDDGRTYAHSLMSSIAANAGTTYSVDTQNRWAPVITQPVICTAAGASINSITAGAFYGQELIIKNKPSSTQSLTLTNAGGAANILIGSNETIAVGKAYRLVWDGFDWTSAG